MEYVFASYRLRSQYIARTLLLLLLTWFAPPETKSYTPHFNPKLDRRFEQTIFLQLDLTKYNPGDNLIKLPGFITYRLQQQLEQNSQSKCPVICIELNAFHCNAYYVHNTTNAP